MVDICCHMSCFDTARIGLRGLRRWWHREHNNNWERVHNVMLTFTHLILLFCCTLMNVCYCVLAWPRQHSSKLWIISMSLCGHGSRIGSGGVDSAPASQKLSSSAEGVRHSKSVP